MLLTDLVNTSAAVANASSRLAKIGLLADLLRRLAPEEIEMAIGFLSGEPRQGRLELRGIHRIPIPERDRGGELRDHRPQDRDRKTSLHDAHHLACVDSVVR